MKVHLLATAAALAIAAGISAPAYATITFSTTPTGTGDNIQFEQGATTPALSQIGDDNKLNSPVIFDTNFTKGVGSLGGAGLNQFIAADGVGQGNIVCEGAGPTACGTAGKGSQLQSLEIKPGAGFGWSLFVANPKNGEGTMNVFAQDNLGNNFDFTLGNGQNFFTLTASGGEIITDVQLSQQTGTAGPFGFDDFDQPRVTAVVVPAPVIGHGLWGLLMIGGVMLSQRLFRRRRGPDGHLA